MVEHVFIDDIQSDIESFNPFKRQNMHQFVCEKIRRIKNVNKIFWY